MPPGKKKNFIDADASRWLRAADVSIYTDASAVNVKSATRVLRVLEYFDGIRREAGVTEISRALGFPVSSTSGLLQSLVELGYLSKDRDRLYRLTPRVTLLGSWVDPTLAPGGPVLSLMQELSGATGETVALGIPLDITVRYIHVIPATNPMRLHVGPGDVRPMALSGMGRLFLSTMSDDAIRHVLFRHNALQRDDETRLSLSEVRSDIDHIRDVGYSVSIDRIAKGAGLVCMTVPTPEIGLSAIAVGGLSETIRANFEALAVLMKGCIDRHLGYLRDPINRP
ncbi:helix-turn-helix domain-containing protein [soil metagenome]